MLYFLVKCVLVLALLVPGMLFFVSGMGVEIPLIEYRGLEADGVPIGFGFLAAGLALATENFDKKKK